MKKIILKSAKGGVGKSVFSLNLSACLQSMGYRVLLIDLDINTGSLSKRLAPKKAGILDLLKGKKVEPVLTKDGFSFLPKGKGEEEAITKKDFKNCLKNFESNFDFCLFDHSPYPSELSKVSMKWADLCLIPTYPDILSMDGTALTMKLCKQENLELRIIFNRVSNTKLSLQIRTLLKEKFPDLVLDNFVKQRTSIAESLSFQGSVMGYNGLAAMDFKDVVIELLESKKWY